jgi:hypothetical protein
MTLSNAGLIGAAVGFAVTTALYLAVSFALNRETQPASGASAEERERSMSMIRLILLADIPILTGLGYYLGQMFE